MNNHASDKQAIGNINKRLKELWLKKQYDEIGEYLAEDVIVAPPGSDKRIRGRDAYIESYRQYDQVAVTKEYSPGEPQIDVIGNTAVAICPFYVVYEMNEKVYKENGREILVFSQIDGDWKVAWRTMIIDSNK